MEITVIREVLKWCSIINIGLLTWWALILLFAHDFIYKLHSRWFKISLTTFDALHYGGIGLFKIFVFTFNIVPYIALIIIS